MRNTIDFGNFSFSNNAISSLEVVGEESLNMRTLAVDTLEAIVICDNPGITSFNQNEPIYIRRNGSLVATFFADSVTRNGKNSYLIKGISSLGRLMQFEHYGGVYFGKKAGELIDEICGDIPHIVGSVFLNAEVYGWLPIAEARNNLAQVLFAIGANLKTDSDGTLRIDNLGTAPTTAIRASAVYEDGAAVEYMTPITDVVVLQHAFSPPLHAEEKTLFKGTASDGQMVVFSEPIVASTIIGTGIQLAHVHENYAILKEGSGEIVGAPYSHTMAEVRVPVCSSVIQNVERVEDAFLASNYNAGAVALRLANYYKQRTRINASIVRKYEAPGDVVSIIDPFELIEKNACIEKMSVSFSKVAKASITSIVDFLPHQEKQYIDALEKLTGSGTWIVPAGVSSVTAVLIGGGDGGEAGERGGDPLPTTTHSVTGGIEVAPLTYPAGGAGGAAGSGGAGGAVLRVVMTVAEGERISFSCGAGGIGAVFGEASDDRLLGGDTFFGNASTRGIAHGDTYFDPTTETRYALPGAMGVKGMDGSGALDYSFSDTEYYVPEPLRVGDEVWFCGQRYEPPRVNYEQYGAVCMAGYGGGAAVGADGYPSSQGNAFFDSNRRKVFVVAGAGGNGADARKPVAAIDDYGYGGAGGNGGGGAGSTGGAYGPQSASVEAPNIAKGGAGSDGGDGGAGCILLYYRIPAEQGGNVT